MKDQTVRISKTLSLWLRHKPDAGGLRLSPEGWARIDDVLKALQSRKLPGDPGTLNRVVETNDKKRFELSADGLFIRARQGHSIEVDLALEPVIPPDILYHGTVERFLPSILEDGLKPMKRQHVHLSSDRETAQRVGARRGKPVILVIASGAMARAGHRFYLSSNGVWLTDTVAPEFLSGPL